MFTVEILDAKDVRRVAAIIDTADTFDAALIRYAEIAWEDAPAVLLGRTVIVREGGTGDVWAVGSYTAFRRDSSRLPILTFLRRRTMTAAIISFVRTQDERTLRRDHEILDDMLMAPE
jgi:hypothetical protein